MAKGHMPGSEPFFLPGGPVGCLLLHGLTATPREVRELGERLNAVGCTALGIRLPGHATRIEDLDSIRWTDWTRAVDTAYGVLAAACRRVFVLGMSMGACLALLAAARWPVAGVVGLGGLWSLPAYQTFLARLAWPFHPYQAKRGGSSIADPAARARHLSYPAMHLRAALEFDAMLGVMRASLGQVTAPVLLVHSRHDPVAAPAGVLKIAGALGSDDVTLHWVHRSAHIITEDYDKAEVFAVVVGWIARAHAGTTWPSRNLR